MADADAALAQLGAATVLGRGLGAYVALMIAGGRPKAVRGAILCDGPGLDGGTPEPTAPSVTLADPALAAPPDPFALAEMASDVRPADYAASFARQAAHLSGLVQPIAVCARARPPWLSAALAEPGVFETDLDTALGRHARAAVGGQ
jgi:pimeloyl-ACP methyl ester carboxylesterase